MVATSVGITARVLATMGVISVESSRIVLAAAVIDDVIGLLVLAIVGSLAKGEVNYLNLGLTAVLAIGFTVFTVLIGTRTVRRVRQPVKDLRIDHSLLLFALILCFGLAAAAHLIGIAGIVGAFLAGVAMSESTEHTNLRHQAQTLTEFAAPFFLVNIGMTVDLSIFRNRGAILLAAVVTVLAIISKLVGCGLAAIGRGRRQAFQVGVGMIPRGEVGIIVAQIGLVMGAVSNRIYAVVVIMVVVTTMLAPFLIKRAFKGEQGIAEDGDAGTEYGAA
jgi:Kef-type K+ transport system membrane component KefB